MPDGGSRIVRGLSASRENLAGLEPLARKELPLARQDGGKMKDSIARTVGVETPAGKLVGRKIP